MSCEKLGKTDQREELFDSLFDKEIKDSDKKKLLAHLDECSECSLQYKLYEAMINGMERLEEVDAPADLTANVMKGIQSEPQPVWEVQPPFLRPASTSWMWAGAFAVAFFLMVGTFVNWDSSQPPRLAQLPPNTGGETPHLGEDRNHDDLAQQPRVHVPAAPELGIVLVQHQGEVEVLDLATNEWRAIHGQENLNFGDRVRTGAGGDASLEYTKEHIALRIKSDSTMQVVDRQTLRVFAGSTWVSVKKKGTVFRTETPNAIASVRGTKYSVTVQPLPSLYANELVRIQNQYLAQATPSGTVESLAWGARLAWLLTNRLGAANLAFKGDTEVKVYESVVEVVAKNSSGVQVSAIDVPQGFASRVQLAMVNRPRVLNDSDYSDWRSVMVYDPDIIAAAQAKAAAGPVTSAPPAGMPVNPLTQPATDAGPVSSSERPQGFEDINRSK